MKTPSPTKNGGPSPTKGGTLSPERVRQKTISPQRKASSPGKNAKDMKLRVGGRVKSKLSVMGHSMVSRSGDPESEVQGLNCDLRLITGRMAQTLDNYEVKAKSFVNDQVRDVEEHLDEIPNPILKLQIKMVLEDYKSLSEERENLLGSLEDWFNNCSDEFLDELMDYEQQFEGEESLMDNVEQAKNIISKIKFINKKIVEFQSSGLNTQKLVNQKKSLEHELMKKKVIVDSTAKDSELLTVWKNNIGNMLNFVKDSSASEIDKAILDMKMTEASDHIVTAITALQKTGRRVGVLFKSVKELEFSNAQLAEENSFLKQRLSKTDKHFKELMTKAVNKLETETDEELASLLTSGKGTKPADVNKMVSRGNKLSMEMEMIENYQQTIHSLDQENKDLIGKLDTLEEESEDLKEEVKTLEEKIKFEENKKARRESQMAHPLVKMEPSDEELIRMSSMVSGTSETSNKMPNLGNTGSFRGKNQINHKGRRESNAMVSTITVQDSQEMDAVKTENDIMRMQMQKLKIALANARKQQKRGAGQNMATQTSKQMSQPLPVTEKRVIQHRRRTPSPVDEPEMIQKEKRVVKKFKPFIVKKRVVKKKIVKNEETNEEEEHEFSEVEEEEGEEEVEEEVEEEEEEEAQPEEENYIDDFLDDELCDDDFNSDAPLDELVNTPLSSPIKSVQPQESPKPTLHPVESPPEEEPPVPVKREAPFKPVLPVRVKKQRVKFDEPEEVIEENEPSPEAPEFKRIPTPRVTSTDPIKMLGKIREELKEFLQYGQSFVSSVNECIQITADNELANTMEEYSNLEKRVNEMEISLNILLYGVDLGMSLMTPSKSQPLHSPIPFENKLYFQENLSKYLRAKYPKLNINAIKVFDSDLTPGKPISKTPSQPRLPSQPFGYPTQHDHFFDDFLPLNTTPEPKIRRTHQRPKSKPRKPTKKVDMGKLEEIMQSLTSGKISDKKKAKEAMIDNRTFSEIVEHVMPKEMVMEYLKLIQPTHDTTGKRQYHDKLMRGVSKVKDLLDVVNMGPHQSIIKGLPTNKLGEPRVRQTKVHRNNLVVNDIVTGQSSPASVQFPSQIENYRAKLRMNDERVRASLDDYNYDSSSDLHGSGSLTVIEAPLSTRGLNTMGDVKKMKRLSEEREDKIDGDMFCLTSSNPNLELGGEQKRTFLPVVTQNLLPHAEIKKAPPKKLKPKMLPELPNIEDGSPPKISDILNLGWERQKPKNSQNEPLPKISDKGKGVWSQNSFP